MGPLSWSVGLFDCSTPPSTWEVEAYLDWVQVLAISHAVRNWGFKAGWIDAKMVGRWCSSDWSTLMRVCSEHNMKPIPLWAVVSSSRDFIWASYYTDFQPPLWINCSSCHILTGWLKVLLAWGWAQPCPVFFFSLVASPTKWLANRFVPRSEFNFNSGWCVN